MGMGVALENVLAGVETRVEVIVGVGAGVVVASTLGWGLMSIERSLWDLRDLL
jgi:prefoldin subunit 5